MRLRTIILALVALVIVLPAAALLIFVLEFDPNSYAPQIIAAVDKATGRQLTLGGPIELERSFTPTIEVTDVSLSNPPGFAAPNLLTISRAEAQISLLPLLSHRVDIVRLVLTNPNFALETNAAGQADWDFSTAQPASAAPAPSSSQSGGYKIALESVAVQNGQVTVKSPSQAMVLALPSLTGTADSTSAPLNLQAAAAYNGTPFTLAGSVGPVERFSGIGSGPWPVNLTLTTVGATATVDGAVADPKTGRGFDVTITASIPALESLAPVLPPGLLNGQKLPPIHGIAASARIVDQNSTIPAIDNLSIKAGASDLSSFRPGLKLASLDIEMASLDQPSSINLTGSINNAPLTLAGQFGAVQSLFNPALLPSTMPPQGSFPVNLQAQAGNAKLTVTGAIATPEKLAGAALAVNAAIPDLTALAPLAGAPLPTWKNLQVQTTIIDPGGLGLRKAVGVDSLAFSMDNAAFGGDASLYFGAQPRLQAALSGQQINLDALIAAMPPPAPAPTTTPAPATPTPAPPPATYIIPTQKLPLGLLKTASADIQLSADTLVFNNATYSAIQGHAVLANGVLTVTPLTGQLPGGSVSATATLDASQDPAKGSVMINAPALALSPFLKAIDVPDSAQGTLQAQLTASGTGDSLHDMAATMNGQLGMAMVNGIVDGSVLKNLFGAVLRTVGLPEKLVGAQGPVAVRCFALRVDATNGTGAVRALTLDSSRLLVQGGGSLNFGNETLAIVLRPQMQLIGNQVGVPVEIGGTFSDPSTGVAPFGALRDAARTAVGLPLNLAQEVVGGGGFLGQVASTLGVSQPDVCPVALNLGRLGQPGPAAPPPVAAAASANGLIPTISSGPKSLLNSLFGK
jgi:AsmA protein